MQTIRFEQADQRSPINGVIGNRFNIDHRQFIIKKIRRVARHFFQCSFQASEGRLMENHSNRHHRGNFDFDGFAGQAILHKVDVKE